MKIPTKYGIAIISVARLGEVAGAPVGFRVVLQDQDWMFRRLSEVFSHMATEGWF